jgi:tyrosinase
MGSVPTAAQDPIFWLHHCNIDRLWASWIAAGGKNPTDSTFVNEPFTFADPNGNAFDTTSGSVLDPSTLGYSYDRLETRPADCPPFAARETAGPPVITHQGSGPVTLGSAPTVLALRPTAAAARETAGAHTWLIISGVSAPASPGTVYQVSVSQPASANAAEREPRRVGTLNFFDAVPHQGHAARTDKAFAFDVTGIVRSGANPSVTIAPRRQVAGNAQVTVGSVQLVRR